MYFSIWFNGITFVQWTWYYRIKWWRPKPPCMGILHLVIFDSIVQNSKIYSIKCEQERKSHFSHERFSNNNHCQNHRNHNRYCGQPCKCVLSYSQPTQNIQNRFYPMGACASLCVYDDVFCVHVAICYCSTCYCWCGIHLCQDCWLGATTSHYHNRKSANSVRIEAETFIFIACHSIVTVDCSLPASIL